MNELDNKWTGFAIIMAVYKMDQGKAHSAVWHDIEEEKR